MNIEREYASELDAIRSYIEAAKTEYSNNYEGNTIQLHTETTHLDAQAWKFMLQNDGKVLIVPMLSLQRGLKSDTTGSVLSVNADSWILEKVGL